MKKLAINGFGRIGRLLLRAWLEDVHNGRQNVARDLDIVCLNGRSEAHVAAHLFAYDSTHGRYEKEIKINSNSLCFDNVTIPWHQWTQADEFQWNKYEVDIVCECTGAYNSAEKAQCHIDAGAKKILFSAPAKNADITIVYGVNHTHIMPQHNFISNASCTTNCLAPIAQALHNLCGINSGFMTTIHAYTNDQKILDGNHKDMRRARAGALSIIPTTTGATKAVELVLPELKGRLSGSSLRVPTPNVSMIDFVFIPTHKTSCEEINAYMKKMADTSYKDIIAYNDKPLVSIDFNHTSYSAVFDSTETYALNDNLIRVIAWYDNEWGYTMRMLDTANHITV